MYILSHPLVLIMCVNFSCFINRELARWKLGIKKNVFLVGMVNHSFLIFFAGLTMFIVKLDRQINQKNQSPWLQLSEAKYCRIAAAKIRIRTIDVAYQMDVSPHSGESLIKRNWHNFRTSDDIDMKLGPVTKLDKRNNTTSKKMKLSCREIVTPLPFSNLRPIWSIPDAGVRTYSL